MLLNVVFNVDATPNVVAADPGFPWRELQLTSDNAHQGMEVRGSDGTLYLVDNSYLRAFDNNMEVAFENTDPESDIGSASYQDPVIFNNELVFRTGLVYTFWDLDDLSFLRSFTGTQGGSTLCLGPDPTKLYSFSYSDTTKYWVIDPTDGSTHAEVILSGETLTDIQGSVWSERDQVFYVSSDTANTIHSVSVLGVASAPVHTFSGSGTLEGMATYNGQIYFQVLGGSQGTYVLLRDGVGEEPAQGDLTYVGAGATDASSGALSAAVPAGVVAGDLLILHRQTDGNDLTALQAAPPAGWTVLEERTRGNAYTFALYWKIAEESEAAVSMADYGAGMTTMFAVRGVDQSDPIIDFSGYFPAAGSANEFKLPEVTSVRENSMYCSWVASGADASSGTADVFTKWNVPGYRGLQEMISRVHPFGGGGAVGAILAEIPNSTSRNRHGFVEHFAAETYRMSFGFVIQPPA